MSLSGLFTQEVQYILFTNLIDGVIKIASLFTSELFRYEFNCILVGELHFPVPIGGSRSVPRIMNCKYSEFIVGGFLGSKYIIPVQPFGI